MLLLSGAMLPEAAMPLPAEAFAERPHLEE
jgi:hypothetical protein